MYCKNCGKEIHNEAVKCVHCGALTENLSMQRAVNDRISVDLLIVSILIPIIGIVLGVVNLNQERVSSGRAYLWTSVGIWITAFLIILCSI